MEPNKINKTQTKDKFLQNPNPKPNKINKTQTKDKFLQNPNPKPQQEQKKKKTQTSSSEIPNP